MSMNYDVFNESFTTEGCLYNYVKKKDTELWVITVYKICIEADCVSQFFILSSNTWDNHLGEKKRLLWLRALEVSVHGQWSCCFWAPLGKNMVEEVAHLCNWEGKREREEGLGSQHPLQKHALLWGSESSTTFQKCHEAGDQVCNTWTIGGHLRSKYKYGRSWLLVVKLPPFDFLFYSFLYYGPCFVASVRYPNPINLGRQKNLLVKKSKIVGIEHTTV